MVHRLSGVAVTHLVADARERTTYCGQRRKRADAAHVYAPLTPIPADACPKCVAATRPSPSLLAAAHTAREIIRRRGRPVGTIRKPQAGQIGVRLTVDERDWLRVEAAKHGTTEAGMLRALIRAKRDKDR